MAKPTTHFHFLVPRQTQNPLSRQSADSKLSQNPLPRQTLRWLLLLLLLFNPMEGGGGPAYCIRPGLASPPLQATGNPTSPDLLSHHRRRCTNWSTGVSAAFTKGLARKKNYLERIASKQQQRGMVSMCYIRYQQLLQLRATSYQLPATNCLALTHLGASS
jgi:hypothetical protein